jgi:hypothetical protein
MLNVYIIQKVFQYKHLYYNNSVSIKNILFENKKKGGKEKKGSKNK